MHVPAAFQLILQLTTVSQVSYALRLPFRHDFRAQPRSTSVVFANAGDPYNFNVVDFTGDNQIIYVANITIDGQSYEASFGHICAKCGFLHGQFLQVQLDTGSSDLFVDTQSVSFTNANNTGLSATLVYG